MKVRCTACKKNEHNFTVGKVYEWNGSLTCDDGFAYDTLFAGTDPKKWELAEWYAFEVVPAKKAIAKIIIEVDDEQRVTTARYIGDGEKKTAEAVRNPEDKFDLYTGAKLALDRLFSKEEKKPEHKFKIGEKVIGNEAASKKIQNYETGLDWNRYGVCE